MLNKKHYVYILCCADNTFYTGYTTDICERIKTHNGETGKQGAKYTRARRPVRLVYQESFLTRSAALKREAEIKKKTRAQKNSLVRSNAHPLRNI